MINVHDFCNTCADGTKVKLSFYDISTRDFIVNVVFSDAKAGSSALGFAYAYADIESIYVSAGVVCCKCFIFNS